MDEWIVTDISKWVQVSTSEGKTFLLLRIKWESLFEWWKASDFQSEKLFSVAATMPKNNACWWLYEKSPCYLKQTKDLQEWIGSDLSETERKRANLHIWHSGDTNSYILQVEPLNSLKLYSFVFHFLPVIYGNNGVVMSCQGNIGYVGVIVLNLYDYRVLMAVIIK